MKPPHRIQEVRERQNLTRSALAKKLRITRLQIWRIETGAVKLTVDELPRFARALGVEPSELLAA